jgi:predicted O-methyltransferase YrrM
MLEIGSFYGDSVQMWQEYLHPDSLIVGIDVNSKLVKIANAGEIHVWFVEEKKGSLLKKVTDKFGPFDIILDDGGHTPSIMVDRFRRVPVDALNHLRLRNRHYRSPPDKV